MLIPNGKIEKLVSKDVSRPVLTETYLKISDDKRSSAPEAFLEATNSLALVRIPVDVDDGDTAGFIPVEAILEARKTKAVGLMANDDVVRVEKGGRAVEWKREDVGSWPDSDRLIPEPSQTYICFDAGLLHDLAMALGTKGVRVFVPESGTGVKPIRVEALDHPQDGRVGVCMPIREKK